MPRGIPNPKPQDRALPDALRGALGPRAKANRDDPQSWAARFAPAPRPCLSPCPFAGNVPHVHDRTGRPHVVTESGRAARLFEGSP
jgi:hypothetical protein